MGLIKKVTESTVYFVEANTGLSKYDQVSLVSLSAPTLLYLCTYEHAGHATALLLAGAFGAYWNKSLFDAVRELQVIEQNELASKTATGQQVRESTHNIARYTLGVSVVCAVICPPVFPLLGAMSATNYVLAVQPKEPGKSLLQKANDGLQNLIAKMQPYHPIPQPAPG